MGDIDVDVEGHRESASVLRITAGRALVGGLRTSRDGMARAMDYGAAFRLSVTPTFRR